MRWVILNPYRHFDWIQRHFFITSTYKKTEDPNSGLDFTIVAIVETSLEGRSIYDFGYAQLDQKLGKVVGR